jgi:hypothetical protein
MKVKQTILSIGGSLAIVAGVLVMPTAVSADCAGVKTAIVSCDQPGPCPGGVNPYEGMNPGTDEKQKTEYKEKYKHTYGFCDAAGTVKPNDTVSSSGIWGVLLFVLKIMTAGVGVLAVLGVVWAAVLYTTADDRADQVKKAKDMIWNVVFGLIAFGLMYALLNFLIPGGIFTV